MIDRPDLGPLRPPPDPPELPEGVDPRPAWPTWFAPVGFVAAIGVALVGAVVLAAIWAVTGGDLDDDPPALLLLGTLVQDAALIGTAIFFAARVARPRPWHFGLRRTRFLPAFGWTALALFSFLAFAGTYGAIVDPEGQQTIAEDLGADESAAALVASAVLIVVIAPIAEEFFFRGFFYRALRTRLGVWAAAAVDAAVFGAVHFSTGADVLDLLPVLAVLGVIFCLLYERTGSLYPVIALHALNNSVAYAFATDGGGAAALSVSLGAGTIAACVLVPRYVWRRAPALA